jgi:hypothetical protein
MPIVFGLLLGWKERNPTKTVQFDCGREEPNPYFLAKTSHVLALLFADARSKCAPDGRAPKAKAWLSPGDFQHLSGSEMCEADLYRSAMGEADR